MELYASQLKSNRQTFFPSCIQKLTQSTSQTPWRWRCLKMFCSSLRHSTLTTQNSSKRQSSLDSFKMSRSRSPSPIHKIYPTSVSCTLARERLKKLEQSSILVVPTPGFSQNKVSKEWSLVLKPTRSTLSNLQASKSQLQIKNTGSKSALEVVKFAATSSLTRFSWVVLKT